MKWISFIITVLVITLINAGSAIELISISSLEIRPDLLIAVLAFFAYAFNRRDSIIVAFMVGFMADISGATMGPFMIAFGVIGVCLSSVRDVLLMDRRRNRVVAIFVMSFLIMIIVDILTGIKTGQHITKPLISIPLCSLYTAIVGSFLWSVFDFTAIMLGIKKRNSR